MRINFQISNPFKLNINRLKLNQSYLGVSFNLTKDVFERTLPKTDTVSFSGIRCSKSDFEIKNVKNIRCPICQNTMLDDEQVVEFVRNVSNKKGEALIDALDKYGKESYWLQEDEPSDKTIYSDSKQKTVDIIKQLAYENPDLDLSQIVKLKAKTSLSSLINEQLQILEELLDFTLKNVKDVDEQSRLVDVIETHINIIEKSESEAFKRKKFLWAIKDIVSNPDMQDKINDIAYKLPTSTNDTDAFFVKYSKENRKNHEIARNLVAGNIPTAEHIKCQSDNGGDSIENYLCDCGDCNSKRMSTPFDVWIEGMPDINKNIQTHLDEVQQLIIEGRFSSKYDFYVQDVAKTISKMSKGKIEPKVYSPKGPELKGVIEKRKEEYKELSLELSSLSSKIDSLNEELKELKELAQLASKIGDSEDRKNVSLELKTKTRERSILSNKYTTLKEQYDLLVNYSKKYGVDLAS